MRILFLTNFYPPFEIGGMEKSCLQVVEGLQRRGHDCYVLTSMNGTKNRPVQENGIYRWLYLEMDFEPWRQAFKFFLNRESRENENMQRFSRLVQEIQPDIIFIWGMWNLPRSLAAFAESHCPDQVVYRFADYWPTLPTQYELYWRTPGRRWFSRIPKILMGSIARLILAFYHPPSLEFKKAICVSAATRDALVKAGIPVSHARIIHTGIDETLFRNGNAHPKSDDGDQTLKLLFAGRLSPDKGVEIAIQAIKGIVHGRGTKSVQLSLAGAGAEDYLKRLQNLVDRSGLADHIEFLGYLPSEAIPGLMAKFDAILVPSTWEEPFARVVLEGMAAGLVVIASPMGGSKEILRHGENGLLVNPGDVDDLAEKIESLAVSPQLRRRLSAAGRKTIEEGFTFENMMNQIESYLSEAAGPTDRVATMGTMIKG
jgi:glycosyltransferase involved in cell wall biosynthesis